MTDITAKPFDWNDNLSKEALEDFEGIQKDLPYCTCQNIGMALAKLELLEKQGCKVIEPSVSSSEKPNKCEDAISRQAVLDVTWEEPSYTDALNVLTEVRDKVKALPPVTPHHKMGQWIEHVERDDWDDSEEVWYECDQCHTDWGGPVNFCPNCGVRMFKSQESEGNG